MTKLLISFSITLMMIGLLGYFTAHNPHFTALIPSFFSFILGSLSFLYFKNIIKLKTNFFAVTIVSIILLMGTWRAFLSFDDVIFGSLENPAATISRGITAIVTIVFFSLILYRYRKISDRNN